MEGVLDKIDESIRKQWVEALEEWDRIAIKKSGIKTRVVEKAIAFMSEEDFLLYQRGKRCLYILLFELLGVDGSIIDTVPVKLVYKFPPYSTSDLINYELFNILDSIKEIKYDYELDYRNSVNLISLEPKTGGWSDKKESFIYFGGRRIKLIVKTPKDYSFAEHIKTIRKYDYIGKCIAKKG